MSDPHKYDVLREEGRKALQQQFHEAEAVATSRQTAAPDQGVENYIDAHEARLQAHIKELDAQRAAGKIDRNEQQYLIRRFENTPSKLDHSPSIGAPTHDQPRVSSRGLGMSDRADMVSQQAAANQRLKASIERNAAGKAPEKNVEKPRDKTLEKTPENTNDPSKKPPTIER